MILAAAINVVARSMVAPLSHVAGGAGVIAVFMSLSWRGISVARDVAATGELILTGVVVPPAFTLLMGTPGRMVFAIGVGIVLAPVGVGTRMGWP